MKMLLTALAVCILLSAFINPGNNKDFKKLYALQGVWQMTTKRGIICEEWKKVNKDYLQNTGYIIKGSDTIINERVALTNTGNNIFYTSTVADRNDKKPVAFKMTKAENNNFIFENRQHDFPKRIVYQLISSDSLHAYIDDGIDGSGHIRHFYYKRFK
jgi:Domain of unknown function (DUF6265)